MSTALVRCPNCGSVSSQTSVPDEYVCSHCNARFKFVRPGDHVVTHDVRAHYCPVCDRPVEAGKGFRCKRCLRVDICTDCIKEAPEGYICISCLKRDGDDCQFQVYTMDSRCGEYAQYKCVVCDKPGDTPPDHFKPSTHSTAQVGNPSRVCEKHKWDWGIRWQSSGGGPHGTVWLLYCETCGGRICPMCASRVSEGHYNCRKCGSQLRIFTEDADWG